MSIIIISSICKIDGFEYIGTVEEGEELLGLGLKLSTIFGVHRWLPLEHSYPHLRVHILHHHLDHSEQIVHEGQHSLHLIREVVAHILHLHPCQPSAGLDL